MSEIYLYDSLSNKKKKFEPIDQNHVRIYACGPTVYNYAHIGNARMAVVFDSFVRLLRNKYPKVTYVSNITDIDDKIIEAANESNIPINELTKKYTDIYNADMSYLNVLHPDIQPKATEYVEDMVNFIDKLIQKDKAYEKDGHVFFHVPSHEGYGKLSNREIDQQLAGSRVQVSDIKKNQQDFVLWKPSSKSQPGWESPWGIGRPGWHTECCVMSEVNLKIPFDIHGGGQDLLFPHHENEIAQSCASVNSDNPEDYAKYWIHNGFVTIDGEKMSKSLNNIILLNDLLKEHDGETIRLALLSSHYRKSLDWNENVIKQSKVLLDKVYDFLDTCDDNPDGEIDESLIENFSNDLDIPKVLTSINELLKNKDSSNPQTIRQSLLFAGSILGVFNKEPSEWNKQIEISNSEIAEIDKLIIQRKALKENKDFAGADAIRDSLLEKGIELIDSEDGTTWKSKS